MPDVHSLLGPSNAHIWINCTPALRMGEHEPDPGSPYAAAGTLAHSIAEVKARSYFLEPCSKRKLNALLKPLREDPNYDSGMEAATDTYLDYLKDLAVALKLSDHPIVMLERRVDISDYVPEGFGTADCIMLGEDTLAEENGQMKIYTLAVVDYKNGAGVPVSAEENGQMMLYALGALKIFNLIYGDTIQHFHFAIVQPHAGGVKEWACDRDYLLHWGESIRPIARQAWAGEGDPNPGDWCRFCRVRAQCPARIRALLELEPVAKANPDPRLLTDDQLGGLLTRGEALMDWVADLKGYILAKTLSGERVEGWKLVAGRATRDWKGGTDEAFAQLQARGVQEALLYERKPVSPAGLEKAVGKSAFGAYADLVEKKPGKPTLVPSSDPRPDFDPAAAAFGAVSTE